MKVGDKIRVQKYIFNHPLEVVDYTVEEFRFCLGIFVTGSHREAGDFTPLCELYEPGPDSAQRYISNYGEYHTNMVQSWMDMP